ncbi:hypothetical protein LEMA_P061170.1 [Plenodomus lingam JN3]|uniref:Uncharacterized protein n=1 Tax=Leptosphaeria maculans (strain JN3 / isolate v23.1.3 / race Av1-4-5-6-7-8) TaxID=985895 RepID=E4ZIR2_LEPMJ|nr:hypothetical protein LEMA_P061170.1 [Plenodomus lingam JN3]CBX91083.1 hypothetical protein LEMA_P061170.1 [Plenodomus lingam JN3]
MYADNHILTAQLSPVANRNRPRPAAFLTGRQRRRLTRRSHLPQFAAEAAASESSESSEPTVVQTSINLVAPYEAMRTATPPGPAHGTLGRISPSSSDYAYPSRRPTSAGTPIADAGGKKKFGLFNLNTTRATDPSESMAITSPLPPMTPSKAKQLLGFHPEDARNSRDRLDSPSEQLRSNKSIRSKDENVDVNPAKKLSFWDNNKKGLKRFDMRPRHTKHAKDGGTLDATFEGFLMDPRIEFQSSRRNRRKKAHKSLHRMAPITEMSHDGLNAAYRNIESNTELDVISEYESPGPQAPRNAFFLQRSQTESVITSLGPFTLSEGDISPSDRDHEDVEQNDASHLGSQANPNHLKSKQPEAPPWRSPLQRYETGLLDDLEEELKLHVTKLDRSDAARTKLDAEVAEMKRRHVEFKREFEAMEQQQSVRYSKPVDASDTVSGKVKGKNNNINNGNEDEEEDDDDLNSINSSIDIDEEPVVCEARAMTFVNATGLVKPIYITKRKTDVALRSKNDEGSLLVSPTHMRNTSYDRFTKDAKPKMSRSESQLLVQDWVTRYDRNQQRPVSERIDPDVLADQRIPPAPFPKDEPGSPHPPRSSSRYHCLQNGHIFRAIDLKKVPDEVGINNLEVRPYLRTHSGIKQHVRVPVSCGRCGEDVDEKLWECKVPVCHIAVCGLCAVNMRIEREERAVASRVPGTWTNANVGSLYGSFLEKYLEVPTMPIPQNSDSICVHDTT